MGTSPAGASSPDLSNRSRIMTRIERDTGVPHLADILSDRLAPTDLKSLLLEVYARRAKRRDPKALLDDHVSNRFAQPSASNPGHLLEWDKVAFSKLPKAFRPVELSPVCPLGAASVLSPVSQDWIVSTIRNTEVVADSTNVLALECAVRRREQKNFSTGHADPVHLAASHRLLRARRSVSALVFGNTSDFFPCAAQAVTLAIFDLKSKQRVSTSDSSLRRSRSF